MSAFVTSTTRHLCLRKQSGAVLMIMLVIIVLGSIAFLVSELSRAKLQIERDQMTSQAFAQAKEALIGYAVAYGDTNSNVNGFLPCPDQGQNVTYDGEAKSTCAAKNVTAIGKLPWKTLGLPPLKDGNGDCLWYAVSGTYKNNPDTNLMNWDNYGLFQTMATDGVSFLAGSSSVNQPVAVIFSPGPPIGTQTRTPATNTPSCGGNYTTSNYLDNDTIHGINNATVSATANTVTQFISGQVKDLSGNEIVNDRLLIITRDEIFNAIKKRNDFGNVVVPSPINQAVTCLGLATLPNPIIINFDTMLISDELPGVPQGTVMNPLITGRISDADCTGTSNITVKKWRDNLAYAKCSSGLQCLTVNGASCRGVIIFTGEQTTSQNRISSTQRNNWNNYLEGNTLNIFISGAAPVLGAPPTYNSASPSTDIWQCIP